MPVGYEFYKIISMVTRGVHFLALVVGLIIAYRQRWLSDSMFIVIASLAGLCGAAGLNFSFRIVGDLNFLGLGGNSTLMFVVYSLISVTGAACWIGLIVGMTRVARDVRERFQRMRELLDEQTDRSAAIPGANS